MRLDAACPDFKLIVEDDGDEVAEAEVGPVIFDEVNLDVVGGLPEQVVTEASDAAGSDEDVERRAVALCGHHVVVDSCLRDIPE